MARKKSEDPEEIETVECPNCGMPKDEWPNPAGYTDGDETFCCEGCADGTGCTCGEEEEVVGEMEE
jgi:hypothetical protein